MRARGGTSVLVGLMQGAGGHNRRRTRRQGKKTDGPDADRPSIQATVTRRLALKSHWIFHEGQEERGIGGVGDMLDPGDMTAEEFYNDM